MMALEAKLRSSDYPKSHKGIKQGNDMTAKQFRRWLWQKCRGWRQRDGGCRQADGEKRQAQAMLRKWDCQGRERERRRQSRWISRYLAGDPLTERWTVEGKLWFHFALFSGCTYNKKFSLNIWRANGWLTNRIPVGRAVSLWALQTTLRRLNLILKTMRKH